MTADQVSRAAVAHLWFPWSPVPGLADLLVVIEGEGCYAVDARGRRLLDARGCKFNAAVGYGRREAVAAKLAGIERRRGGLKRMDQEEIRRLVDALGGLLSLLRTADPADRSRSTGSLGCG